ncbi:MAG: hypothetical protein NUV98_03945 [Candidatus Roizmanbacteria bacterium]|nr:hypothetical protein [Candidatus Roizmanbacteria bacterium]
MTIKDIAKLLDEKLEGFATKEDLQSFATKDDLERFATKEDLSRFATKEDLKQFATKDDLMTMEKRSDKKFLQLFNFLDKEVMSDRKRIERLEEKTGITQNDY